MTGGKDGFFEITLTDADIDNPVHRVPWAISSGDFRVPGMPAWSARRRVLRGGKQEGVDVIEVDNGRMSFTIVPTRGMNIYRARCDGLRLGWDSPVGQLVHPAWINLQSRGGTGWLEGFNELVSRCGLASTGAPCIDTLVDNRGNRREMALTLHGEISNTPAARVRFRCELAPPFRISVEGEVAEGRMFGPSYLLKTCISTLPGGDSFRISDEVVNAGDRPAELEVLYHCNFGRPVLGAGARLVAPVKKLTAVNDHALSGLESWASYGPPEPGFVEQCYLARLGADESGESAVALINAGGDAAARLEFRTDELPAFTLWKMTADESIGYVTGLEPGTDFPNPRPFERERGRVLTLAAGAAWRAALTVGLTSGREAVGELCRRIGAMAPGKPEISPVVDPEMAPAS